MEKPELEVFTAVLGSLREPMESEEEAMATYERWMEHRRVMGSHDPRAAFSPPYESDRPGYWVMDVATYDKPAYTGCIVLDQDRDAP